MTQIIEFTIMVIAISASGVMAPGPLFAANISYGLREGTRSGIKMAIGHTVVEFPLVILLGVGIFSLDRTPEFRFIISILGAITLFIFATIQIKKVLQNNENTTTTTKLKQNPLIAGIVLSALNPFFIIWWLTVGFKLISDAMLIWAFSGILVVFFLHIWMDFVWLGGTSFIALKSSRILSNKNYKIIMIGLSLLLVYFGITFLVDVVP